MDWTAHLTSSFGGAIPQHLAVAVSGGSDSTALMHLMNAACTGGPQKITVLSVDHKLRPESAIEIAQVAQSCASLGVQHIALTWDDWDGQGNLQDAARRARYGLMGTWVRDNGADGLVLGHTADDQAETVLMRMARKAGVDGLSGMSPKSKAYGVTLYRPLLGIRRQALRDYLTDQGLSWTDDPSNDQLKYDRIKMRQALKVLDPLGVTVEGLGDLASYMSETRDALNWQTANVGREICKVDAGEVAWTTEAFQNLPDEIKRRLLVKALCWISGSGYAPRREATGRALEAIESRQKTTLDGCVIRSNAQRTVIYRELNAVQGIKAQVNGAWDGRWQVNGPQTQGAHVAALGTAGAQSVENWRDAKLTLEQVAVHPAIWSQDRLIAAPTLQKGTGFTAKPLQRAEDFISLLLSH